MKKTLLYFLLCLSFTGFAQDWAPFKTTDTIRHYLSSLNSNNASSAHLRNQIQSVVVNSHASINLGATLIFKKGITRVYDPWFQTNQIVKGQIFGDTALISNDSSVFKTSDHLGFTLRFPKSYYLNQSFVFAVNRQGHKLTAVVDSIYIDSVNNSIDSLARFELSFIDSLGIIDTSSHYQSVEVVVSKNNGMIKGIDFTNLNKVIRVEQYFSHKNKFSKNDHFSLTTNDEYHFSDHNGFAGFGDYFQTIIRILNDSTSGNLRTLTLEKRRQKVNPPPSGPVVASIYNYTFDITDHFAVFESQIIADSLLTSAGPASWLNTVPKLNLFYPYNSQQLGLTIDSSNYNIYYSFLTGRKDSIFDGNSALNYSYDNILIGVGDFGNYSYLGNNSWSYKTISYIKKGNQTWGTPLTLAVGLEETNQNGTLRLSPNPASNELRINTDEPVRSILVSDINGKAVEVNRSNKVIDVSNLSCGLYFIQVETENGMFREKFVKQ
ncbi:MAG: hypothetical protein ACJAV5_001838 [Vicingaceae bacterium]|jgi:hypothetical protein